MLSAFIDSQPMNRSLALSSVWFAAPTCTFQVVACRAHLHHPGRLSSSFACSACQSSVTDRWSLGGFWKGLVFGLWLPSTNELCHAVCLHISVFCLGSVSALLCMMTSLGNSLPASSSLALFEGRGGLHCITGKFLYLTVCIICC